MYIRPQVQVFQTFRQLPVNVVANLNAFVFGPNYRLFRYAVAAEKALIGLGEYDPNNTTEYAFPNQPAGSTVDLSYVKLYMEDVWAQYAAISAVPATALVCVSATARNKLRAMPRVEDAEPAQEGSDDLTDGVGMESGGYVYDSPVLPETFYFWPTGGAVGSFMSRLNARAGAAGWDAEDATLAFQTMNEEQRGEVAIPATDEPLEAGHTVQGPFGLVFDLDAGPRAAGFIDYTGQPGAVSQLVVNGTTLVEGTDFTTGATARDTYDNIKHAIHAAGIADIHEAVHIYGATTGTGRLYVIGLGGTGHFEAGDLTGTLANADIEDVAAFNSLRQPVSLVFSNTAGTSYFTAIVDPDSIASSIDQSVDSGAGLKVRWTAGSGSCSATWDSTTRRAVVELEVGVTTLAELRAALVGDTDVAAVLDIGEVVGDETDVVDQVIDETASPVTPDWDVYMIRDAYRIKVYPNDLTFATGNGYTVSSQFKTRGVKVGDRLRYSVVGNDSEVYEGTTEVAALEADVQAAQVMPATLDTDNDATQAGDLLVPHAGLDIVEAGEDNQRKFDGVGTAVFALSPDVGYFPGDTRRACSPTPSRWRSQPAAPPTRHGARSATRAAPTAGPASSSRRCTSTRSTRTTRRWSTSATTCG